MPQDIAPVQMQDGRRATQSKGSDRFLPTRIACPLDVSIVRIVAVCMYVRAYVIVSAKFIRTEKTAR